MEMKNRKVKCVVGVVLIVLLILCAGLLFWNTEKKDENQGDEQSQSEIDLIEYEGSKYSYNYNLRNVLFIGTDTENNLNTLKTPGEAGQADVLLLLSLNKETKKAVIYQIPRETMTEVDIYDENGNSCGSEINQIAYQYANSIGGETSCWAMQKTVSKLLHGLNIDGYIAMDIAAIPKMNDAIGGVTLKITEDYSGMDPQFVKDAVLKLNGKQAQEYLRYQDASQSFGNQQRMERQLQYISALLDAMGNREADYYESIYHLIDEYVLTTLSEDEFEDLESFDLADSEVKFIPGTWIRGEMQDEYHLDETLRKMVMEDFYIKK